MKIILARHGTAEEATPSKPDPERALVDQGRDQAKLMGRVVAATLGIPGAFWSSPLRRAIETARAAMAVMEVKVEPKLVPDLGPSGDLEHLAWLAQRSGTDLLMLFGHQPDLGTLASRLMGLKTEIELKKGGMCIVETTDATKAQGRAVATLVSDQYVEILEGRQYAPWMRKGLRV